MPRGYLKGVKAAGRKKSRGGGSGFKLGRDESRHKGQDKAKRHKGQTRRDMRLLRGDMTCDEEDGYMPYDYYALDYGRFDHYRSYEFQELEADFDASGCLHRRPSSTKSQNSFVGFEKEESSYSLCGEVSQPMSFCVVDEISREECESSVEGSYSLVSSPGSDFLAVDVLPSELKDGEDKEFLSWESRPESAVTYPCTDMDAPEPAPVCFLCGKDGKRLVKLMNKCRHPSACRDCLYKRYILEAQQDLCNYPLKCFGPGCDRALTDVQLCLFTAPSGREMTEHYRLEKRAKFARKCSGVYRCPNPRCGYETSIRVHDLKGEPGQECHIKCIKCGGSFPVQKSAMEEVLTVIAALGAVPFAKCPGCGYIITKAGGCDHMTCFCGREFSFRETMFRFQHRGRVVELIGGWRVYW